jgi:hypothetical protein
MVSARIRQRRAARKLAALMADRKIKMDALRADWRCCNTCCRFRTCNPTNPGGLCPEWDSQCESIY